MTTEELEIAELFKNPQRRSQPVQNITSSTFGKDPEIEKLDGMTPGEYDRLFPTFDYSTPGPWFGTSYGAYGPDGPEIGSDPYGDYDPYSGGGFSGGYAGGGYTSPFESFYGDPPTPPYEDDPYYASGSYDPYAAEDARLAALAAGMPDSTAPSFGSSGVPSAPTSSPSDYYSSPEWLRMLASIQGGLASGAI